MTKTQNDAVTSASRATPPVSADIPGDMPAAEFRAALHRVADMTADYLESVQNYPVVPKIAPGDVRKLLPEQPPEKPEDIDRILDDYKALIEPNTTHWNHPGFMAYFAVTGSGPGILGETLSAALNVNAMLWRTGPAATELEQHVCDWLRQLIGLPAEFRGHINDTASISSMLGLACARHRVREYDIRNRGMAGRADVPRLTIYASDQAHSSIGKAVIVLGIGQDNLRIIPSDDKFRMDVGKLEEAIRADKADGARPLAIVATVGTTSSTSVDPVPAIADICQREGMWLHVDAAYAGVGAICPELREIMPGLERADSFVTNPHKWMFVPVDCSTLFLRDQELLREAFSLVPDYLTTTEAATNLMDYGVQLGRRLRSLKMWMVIRAFGAEGLRARMRNHCAMAREFASWVAAEDGFELIAPVPFSTVCFRATPDLPPAEQDAFNERMLARVNAAGPVLVSHTKLGGKFVLRVTVGNLRTRLEHLQGAWKLIRNAHRQELAAAE